MMLNEGLTLQDYRFGLSGGSLVRVCCCRFNMSIASGVPERFYSSVRDVHQHEDQLAHKVLY